MRYYLVALSNTKNCETVFEKTTTSYREAYNWYTIIQSGMKKGYYLHFDSVENGHHNDVYHCAK